MKNYLRILFLISGLSLISVNAMAIPMVEDPYQNAKDDTTLKKHYLNRIANAPTSTDAPEFKFLQDERYLRHPEEHIYWEWDPVESASEVRGRIGSNSYPGYGLNTHQKYYNHDTSSHPQGAVFITDDANDLTPLFEKVAKKIKTRLVK